MNLNFLLEKTLPGGDFTTKAKTTKIAPININIIVVAVINEHLLIEEKAR